MATRCRSISDFRSRRPELVTEKQILLFAALDSVWGNALSLLVLTCTLVFVPVETASGQGRHDVIVYSGQPVPGVAGAFFDSVNNEGVIYPIGIGDDGTVLIAAYIYGPGVVPGVSDFGLWSWNDGDLTLIVRAGFDVPGLFGVKLDTFGYSDLGEVFIDLNGEIGFSAERTVGPDTFPAFVLVTGGVPRVAFREEGPVLGNFLLHGIDEVEAMNNGRVVIEGSIETGPGVEPNEVYDALLLYDRRTDDLRVIVREEMSMVGAPANYVYKDSGMNHRSLSPFGDVIMNLNGENTGDSQLEVSGIFRWNNGQLSMVEISGVHPSSDPNPLNIYSQTNDFETVLFQHRIDAGPPSPPIYQEGSKGSPIVSVGDAAAGAGGATFTSVGNIPGSSWRRFGIFDNDRAFFAGSLSDGSNGLWIEDEAGIPQIVVRTGDPAPDIGSDMTFDGTIQPYMMANSAGRLAFVANAQSSPPASAVQGLWVGDLSSLDLLLAVGSSVEVVDGDFRTISAVEKDASAPWLEKAFFGRTGRDGKPTKMNRKGHVLAHVDFTGNGGAAVVLTRPDGLKVNSTADAGDNNKGDEECNTGNMIAGENGQEPECTLRAAIEETNASDQQRIRFVIPLSGKKAASPEIMPATELPTIAASTVIDGKTRDGGMVIIDGTNAGVLANGFLVTGAGSTIRDMGIVNYGGNGIKIETGGGHRLEGNSIGINPDTGAIEANQQNGILILNSSNNVIGGETEGAGNMLSGNGKAGIEVLGLGSSSNIIQGNAVGTNHAGVLPFPNLGEGIRVVMASGTLIGDNNTLQPDDARINRIMFNKKAGVWIDTAPGTDIRRNVIFNNEALGIDIAPLGVNEDQPVSLISVVDEGDKSRVTGSLTGTANSAYIVEFFANVGCDASRYGQGNLYMGNTLVLTDGTGNGAINELVNRPINNPVVSATATGPDGNTSEFSKCWPFNTFEFASQKILNPGPDGFVMADHSFRIEWYILEAQPVTKVNLYLWPKRTDVPSVIAEDIDAFSAGGEGDGYYDWAVPAGTLCRTCIIIIEDANPQDPHPETHASPEFRIRGYQLVRIDDSGEYETFDPSDHGWSVDNTTPNWPPQAYSNFSATMYTTDNDPFTGRRYPPYFVGTAVAVATDHPSWPVFVKAFGVDDTYRRPIRPFHNFAAVTPFWAGIHRPWGGSCMGMTLTSLMAFGDPVGFFRRSFDQEPVNRLVTMPITDAVRDVVNSLATFQYGALSDAHFDAHVADTPRQTLAALKIMFLRLDRSQDAPIGIGSPAGGHSVAPIAMTKVPSSPGVYNISIYDPNFNRTVNTIRVDSLNNRWSYGTTWPGNGFFFLEDPLSNYTGEAVPIGFKRSQRPLNRPVVLNTDLVVQTPMPSTVSVENNLGNSIGVRADSSTFNTIPDASFVHERTGYPSTPLRYELLDAPYSVALGSYAHPRSFVSFVSGEESLMLSRLDAGAGQSDSLYYAPGELGYVNPDGDSKSISLMFVWARPDETRSFTFGDMEIPGGASATIRATGDDSMLIRNGNESTHYKLMIRIGTSNSELVFENEQIDLQAGATHLVEINPLDLSQVTLNIDSDSDGVYDSVLILDNVATAIERQPRAELPESLTLEQNFPNPFRSKSTIEFSLPETNHVRLVIYDLLGAELMVLVDGLVERGVHRVSLDASLLTSGTYFYRLETSGSTKTRKMLIVK